jgi:hypothetical protein
MQIVDEILRIEGFGQKRLCTVGGELESGITSE